MFALKTPFALKARTLNFIKVEKTLKSTKEKEGVSIL
jgi:hypothetical protein